MHFIRKHGISIIILLACCVLPEFIEAKSAFTPKASNQPSFDDTHMHPQHDDVTEYRTKSNRKTYDTEYYLSMGQKFVKKQIKREKNLKVAKNMILFLGDGMSMSTLAATRMHLNNAGEEQTLSFERFPNVAMSKTYCVNSQVADSASTATGEAEKLR